MDAASHGGCQYATGVLRPQLETQHNINRTNEGGLVLEYLPCLGDAELDLVNIL